MGQLKATALDEMTDEELAERAELFSDDEADADGEADEDGDDLPTLPTRGFDYALVEEQYRDDVRFAAQVIRAQGHAMRSSILKIGRQLIEIKGMLPHGVFGEWIAAEFSMSERSAERFINVANVYGGKSDILSFLSDSVLYMLAAPSTPDGARQEVERAALSGQKVTVEFAKEAIQKRKPESPIYAPIWQLQHMISDWLALQEKDGGDPDILLDILKGMKQGADSSDFLRGFVEWMQAQRVAYKFGDLMQAINNLREQRRQKALQASAKVTYFSCLPAIEDSSSTESLRAKHENTDPPNVEPEPAQQITIPAHLVEAGYQITYHVATGQWTWAQERTNAAVSAGPFASFDEAVASAQGNYGILHMPAPSKPDQPSLPADLATGGYVLEALDYGYWRTVHPASGWQGGRVRTADAAIEQARKRASGRVLPAATPEPETAPEPELPTPADVAALEAAYPAMPDNLEGGIDRFSQYPVAGEPEQVAVDAPPTPMVTVILDRPLAEALHAAVYHNSIRLSMTTEQRDALSTALARALRV